MKIGRLALLFLLSGLVASCSFNATNNTSNENSNPENQTTEPEKIDEELAKLGDVKSGSFALNNGVITSKKDVSLFLLKDEFDYGTFTFRLKAQSTFSDNGVLLHADKKDNPSSFYFFGFDILGKLSLTKYVDGHASILYKEKVDDSYTSKFVSLGAYFNEANNKIEIFEKDVMLASIQDKEMLAGSYTFLKANGIDTSYKNFEISTQNTYLEDAFYYRLCNGYFSQPEIGTFVSGANNSLFVSESSTFVNGSIEVTMKLNGENKDNGIVFGLSDADKESYWEGAGISYYFYFISIAGQAYLGKANNGGWQLCATKQITNYNNTATYKLKITRHDETIFCFVDDSLNIAYSDSNPLSGEKFGLRAGGSNVTYTNFTVNRSNDDDKSQLENYNVGSGSIDSFDGVIKSTTSKTLAFVKDSNFPEGTLETTFVPGTNSPAGIVFRGTTPNNSDSFYEKEDGLSYYFLYVEGGFCSFRKVENGIITKTTNKYWPYGVSTAYFARILLQGKDIYCYLNERLVFHYYDENPLEGGKYGLKSSVGNCIVAPFIEKPYQAKDTYDYLIFGHSYTDFWIPTYKQDFAEYESIYDIGIGGAITSHWCEEGYQNEVVAYEPNWGIYWNSINDINAGISAGTIRDNVRRMCIGIHDQLPNFKLALVGVCRCPIDSAQDKRTAIHNVNIYYKQIATQLDYVYYVDTELMYCDESGNEISSYFTDGLHPTHEAYIMVATAIKNIINSNS